MIGGEDPPRDGHPPTVLSGVPAWRWTFRGLVLPFFALLAIPIIALERFLPGSRGAWTITCVLAAVGIGGTGIVMQLYGILKAKREQNAGYTSSLETAQKRPDLYFVHPFTSEVIAMPHEARPARIRRKQRTE